MARPADTARADAVLANTPKAVVKSQNSSSPMTITEMVKSQAATTTNTDICYQAGYNSVMNAKNPAGFVNTQAYYVNFNNAFAKAKAANTAYQATYVPAFKAGVASGYAAGATAGEKAGYNIGWWDGQRDAKGDTYVAAYNAAYGPAYTSGYNSGYNDSNGYPAGYSAGYSAGESDGSLSCPDTTDTASVKSQKTVVRQRIVNLYNPLPRTIGGTAAFQKAQSSSKKNGVSVYKLVLTKRSQPNVSVTQAMSRPQGASGPDPKLLSSTVGNQSSLEQGAKVGLKVQKTMTGIYRGN